MSTTPAAGSQFSPAPSNYSASWMATFLGQLTRRLSNLSGPWDAQPFVHLSSPNGTVYRVSVSDTGVLSTSVADRSQPRPTA